MPPVELSNDVLAKDETDSSVVIGPTLDIDFGVRPEQVTEKSSIRHILRSCLLIDALKIIKVGAEATMHTENTIVNNGRNGKNIETNAKLSPNSHIVPSLALIVKSIHSVD